MCQAAAPTHIPRANETAFSCGRFRCLFVLECSLRSASRDCRVPPVYRCCVNERCGMSYSYGAAGLRSGFPFDLFDPKVLGHGHCGRHLGTDDNANDGAYGIPAVAMVRDLPAVKFQGPWPVCSAVAALTMYEQLLLREGHIPALHPVHADLSFPSVEYGWAWIYHSGRSKMAKHGSKETHAVNEQLLGGLPLAVALQALCERGVLTNEDGFPLFNPTDLQKALDAAPYSPLGRLATPLRLLTVMPSADSIYEVLSAQYAIGFVFAVDAEIDKWMHDIEAQRRSLFELPPPAAGSPRLATHAAVVTAMNRTTMLLTIQNSFGVDFGEMGFFYMSVPLFLQNDFTGLQFHVLVRAV